jgi:hypothetical protein
VTSNVDFFSEANVSKDKRLAKKKARHGGAPGPSDSPMTIHGANGTAWYYEDRAGLEVIHEIRVDGRYIRTDHLRLSWAQIRASMRRCCANTPPAAEAIATEAVRAALGDVHGCRLKTGKAVLNGKPGQLCDVCEDTAKAYASAASASP